MGFSSRTPRAVERLEGGCADADCWRMAKEYMAIQNYETASVDAMREVY